MDKKRGNTFTCSLLNENHTLHRVGYGFVMILFFVLNSQVPPANFYKFLPYKGAILGQKKHFQLFTAKSAVYPIKSTFSDISTTTSSIPALTGISFFISFSSTFSAFGVKTKWSKNSVKSTISRYLSSSATRQPPHGTSGQEVRQMYLLHVEIYLLHF